MENLKTLLAISNKINVLYVEDNKEARESMLGLLSNLFTNIEVAVDGKDGLEKFIQQTIPYNLIISDMNMPHMNGEEMIQRIKEIDNNIKVFILSAYGESEKNLTQKVEAYLPKPISFMQLLDEIKKHFN